MPLIRFAVVLLLLSGCADYVTVRGQITPQVAEAVEQQLASTTSDTVVVELESGGGYITNGSQRIVDAIESTKKRAHVVTRVKNYCHSACVMVFLAGDDRLADSNAQFILHGARTSDGEMLPLATLNMLSYYIRRGVSSSELVRAVGDGYFMQDKDMTISGAEFLKLLSTPSGDVKVALK